MHEKMDTHAQLPISYAEEMTQNPQTFKTFKKEYLLPRS